MDRRAIVVVVGLAVLLGGIALAGEGGGEKKGEHEAARLFDFWVGEWDVYNPKGQRVGGNVISLKQGGFIVHEFWSGARGGTGESINFHDPKSGTWRQVWVSSRGGIVEYEGDYRDGAMRFTGRRTTQDGVTVLQRSSFTPLEGGRVRQFIEESKDDGETWSVWFDGEYVPVGEAYEAE